MKGLKKLAVLGFGSGLLAPAWAADTPAPGYAKQELVGFGSGAALGALGGPVGVVMGAALGTWIGSRFFAEHTARLDYEDRWDEARAQVAALRGEIAATEQRLARETQSAQQRLASQQSLLRQALEAQVYFRTGDATLAEGTEKRLHELGAMLAAMEDVTVQLEGYADPRGDAEYNQQLSAERAAAVRDALLAAGLAPGRITVNALGESGARAPENDLDGLALDRRVRLSVLPAAGERQAAR